MSWLSIIEAKRALGLLDKFNWSTLTRDDDAEDYLLPCSNPRVLRRQSIQDEVGDERDDSNPDRDEADVVRNVDVAVQLSRGRVQEEVESTGYEDYI